MPLLILTLIAPMLLFCAVLAFCAFLASREETRLLLISPHVPAGTRPQLSAPAKPAAAQFTALPVVRMFDAEWSLLWATQLQALQLISAAGADGVNDRSLEPLYRQSARRYPELYDGSTFEGWLEFLERANLALHRGGTVNITHAGREFLLVQEQRHWTRR